MRFSTFDDSLLSQNFDEIISHRDGAYAETYLARRGNSYCVVSVNPNGASREVCVGEDLEEARDRFWEQDYTLDSSPSYYL